MQYTQSEHYHCGGPLADSSHLCIPPLPPLLLYAKTQHIWRFVEREEKKGEREREREMYLIVSMIVMDPILNNTIETPGLVVVAKFRNLDMWSR